MRCEFCDASLPATLPENLALLEHVRKSDGCQQGFDFMLENLRGSWTKAMSGG